MNDADLHRYASRIVAAIADPQCYADANIAIARERAKRPADGLLGGLELPPRRRPFLQPSN